MDANIGAMLAVVSSRMVTGHAAAAAPQLDLLMFSSFMSALLTLVLYREYFRSKGYGPALSISAAVTAVLGCMEGAWPMGMVVFVWSGSVFWSWWKTGEKKNLRRAVSAGRWKAESRVSRLFGPRESGHEIWN